MLFFLIWCVALVVGRKLKWVIGVLLYSVPALIAVPLSVSWGVGLAYFYRITITWLHPNWFVALLMFGVPVYLSDPVDEIARRSRFAHGSATREDAIKLATFFPLLIATAVFYFKMK